MLAVFGFLPCGARAMGSSDVLLLLGLGSHLAAVCPGLALGAEYDALAGYDVVYLVCHGETGRF